MPVDERQSDHRREHAGDRRPPISAKARFVARASTCIVAFGTVSIFLAPWLWFAELVTHWSAHLAVFSIIPLIIWRHARIPALVLSVCLAVLLWPGMRAAWTERLPALSEGESSIRLVSANLHFGNPLRAADIRVINSCAADVLVLIEIDTGDEDSFRNDERYPHQVWRHRGNSFQRGLGIAILSRWPIQAQEPDPLLEDIFIDATVATPRGDLQMMAVHPRSPGSAESSDLRNRHFAHMARLARHSKTPLVFLGDLNCTPRSPAWSLLSEAGLQRPAGSSPATWPSWLGPCGIPIDHILGRGIQSSAPEAIFIPGSDHRLVSASIQWAGF